MVQLQDTCRMTLSVHNTLLHCENPNLLNKINTINKNCFFIDLNCYSKIINFNYYYIRGS
jgi:hypothetical protein